MTELSNKQKIPSKGTIKYLFGAFFLLMSLGAFGSRGYIAGLLFFLAAILTIPPAVNQLEKKINVSMPGIAQFFIVFLLVAIAFSATPHTPAALNSTSNNTGTIAASPSAANGREAIAVPAEQTPISNSTSNPANTSAATKASKAVSTPNSTSTQTLDNKGKLEILTSPAGATITVDGVSEGVSPIEGLSVDVGTHSVTVYLSGYDPQKEKVEVANSETKKLFYTLVPGADKNTASVSTKKQNSESTQGTFEDQLRNEISDKVITENNVSYDSTTKALTVDFTEPNPWSGDFLKSEMFSDTTKILELAATHQNEITTVMIIYRTALLDQNRNDVIEKVYVGTYSTKNTNPVNWANTYGDDQANLLKEKADYFWLHPIFNK